MLRIVPAAALLAVVVAGCGGAARPQRSAFHGVPPALAQQWERQASAIASAADAGDDCQTLQHLAARLRTDVLAAQHKLPLRLRAPLVTGVDRLAARITCAPPTTPEKPKPPPEPDHGHKKDHGDHGHHGHGGEGGDGG